INYAISPAHSADYKESFLALYDVHAREAFFSVMNREVLENLIITRSYTTSLNHQLSIPFQSQCFINFYKCAQKFHFFHQVASVSLRHGGTQLRIDPKLPPNLMKLIVSFFSDPKDILSLFMINRQAAQRFHFFQKRSQMQMPELEVVV